MKGPLLFMHYAWEVGADETALLSYTHVGKLEVVGGLVLAPGPHV